MGIKEEKPGDSIKEDKVKDYISNHFELKKRIMHLNSMKAEQEVEIKKSFKEVYYSIYPDVIIKTSINNLAYDTQVKQDLTVLGLNLASDVVIARTIGRKKTIGRFIAAVVAEKISRHVIHKYQDNISGFFGRMVAKLKPG